MSRIRILPTLSALILTFAILFGGYQIYRNYELIRPLQLQLSQIPAVKSANVSLSGANPIVTVKLGPLTDLQTTYMQIENEVLNTFGGPVDISMVDQRSAFLRSAYESMQPIVYQGVAQGNYTGMITALQLASAKEHVSSDITMNAEDIFVELKKGSAYLYDIVPYTNKGVGVSGS